MNIARMHHEYKLRYNRLNSNHKKDFPPAMIDDILNEAQNIYIELFYGGNSIKKNKLGFETTQQRIDMLSTLVVKPSEPIYPQNVEGNVYEFDLSKCTKYRHAVRAYVNSNCGLVNVQLIQHDDLNLVLNDAFRGPSRKWRRLVGAFGSNSFNPSQPSLYVYSEDDFVIEGLFLEYIREPRRVFFGGYDSLEFLRGDTGAYNKNSNPVDTELPFAYHTVLVDIAVRETSRILEDAQRYQLKDEKIFTSY